MWASQLMWTYFFLSFWTKDVTNFLKVMKLMSSQTSHLRFPIFVLETLKFEWQCSQCLELNTTCAIHLWCTIWKEVLSYFREKSKSKTIFVNVVHNVLWLVKVCLIFSGLTVVKGAPSCHIYCLRGTVLSVPKFDKIWVKR